MCIENILIRGPRINEPISSVVFWCIFIIPLAYQPPLYPIQLRTQLVHCTERYPAANENIYTTSINYIISIIIPFQVRRHCFDYKYGIQSVNRERETTTTTSEYTALPRTTKSVAMQWTINYGKSLCSRKRNLFSTWFRYQCQSHTGDNIFRLLEERWTEHQPEARAWSIERPGKWTREETFTFPIPFMQ